MKYFQKGIKGEACYLINSDVTLKSLNASGNVQPKFVDPVQGINLLEAYRTKGGSIVCKYTRTAAVPAKSMYYLYDLRQPHYTMYAFGRTLAPNSFPAVHEPKSERGHSKEPVVFVPETVFFLSFIYILFSVKQIQVVSFRKNFTSFLTCFTEEKKQEQKRLCDSKCYA